MAISVTSYGTAYPATSFLSEYQFSISNTFLSGFETGSRTSGTTYYESRDTTQTIISSTTSSSRVLGTVSTATSNTFSFVSTTSNDTYSATVYDSASVTSVVGTQETFVEDTDMEEGGYWAETTFSQTNTTRTVSTSTTSTGSAFTTSSNTDGQVSFYSTSTTQDVTTSTTGTFTFSIFGTSSATTVLSFNQESTLFVYAEPNEVLWVASATDFDSRAVLTSVGSTVTSHSRKLDNSATIAISTVSVSSVTWPPSTQSLSVTGSYSALATGPATTTIIRSQTTGNVISQFSGKLPHLTETYTTGTFSTTSSTYVQSSYSVDVNGGPVLASEAKTGTFTFVSRYPARVAGRGLEYESLRSEVVSSSYAYTQSVVGYSLVTQSGATVAGNSRVPSALATWVYSPNLQSDFGPFFNVHALTRRTGGFMTYTDNVSGWITGLTVSSDSSLATTVTFAQHRPGRHVPLPGSFEKYTVSKDSFTYTQSTSTESTTSTTTSSTLLALSGQSSLREDRLGFGFGFSQTIGGAAQTGETVFANVIGVAKVNNSTISTFGGTLSSTTNASATASFVNPLATMYAVPAGNTQFDLVTQRNITSMV